SVMRTGFNPHAFPTFKDGSTESEHLQCAASFVTCKFEHAHCRADTRSPEVRRQLSGVFVPNRNGGCSEQNTGVVREGKSEGERRCVACILNHSDRKRRPVSAADEIGERTGCRSAGESH